MNKILLVTLCAFMLISATVIEVQTMIVQPKTPIAIKVLNGYCYDNSEAVDLEAALNTYKNMGYIVKTSSYNYSNRYLIILEKY